LVLYFFSSNPKVYFELNFYRPSGFFAVAVYYLINGQSLLSHRLIICLPYILCGLRFMVGWTFGRKHYKREDGRWNLWRLR
jgi:hypothetical protein